MATDRTTVGRETWLETGSGKPHSSNSFGNKFKSWCVKAGLPQCKCHGLRKIGAVRAAEAGASEHELMAMFGGWDDASMARLCTRRRVILDAAGTDTPVDVDGGRNPRKGDPRPAWRHTPLAGERLRPVVRYAACPEQRARTNSVRRHTYLTASHSRLAFGLVSGGADVLIP
jgi:hypothetical protein